MASATSPDSLTAALAAEYEAALVAGDRPRALAAVEEGLQSQLDAATLLLAIIARGQRRLGELWHRGEISIAEEHLGSELARESVERVVARRHPARRLGVEAVVLAAPGESHVLPARIIACLLGWRGWSVDFVGAAPPVDDVVRYVESRRPDLVAISATLPATVPGTRALCAAITALEPRPKVLLGGAAFAGATAAGVGAGALCTDALEGLERAAELVGLGSERDLESYLSVVGGRIHRHRRAIGLSQAELAERSGLTRPYLSAVERGRQNITLDAALKIAGALQLAMTDLLSEGPDGDRQH